MFRTQAPFRKAIGDVSGREPSAAWLSGIENGTLPLTADRRDDVAVALQLHRDDWELLDAEVTPTLAQDLLVRYAAWQSVRLALANELWRLPKDEAGRTRARAARDRLRDLLIADPDVYDASRKLVGQLSVFSELPEATRWILLVEAAFMDPFLPWQPCQLEWRQPRVATLKALSEELGLTVSEKLLVQAEKVRVAPIAKVAAGKAANSPAEEPAGVSAAYDAFWDPDERVRALRGGEPVGAMGWGFAGGLYLVRHSSAPELASAAPAQHPLVVDPIRDTSPYLASGGLPKVLSRGFSEETARHVINPFEPPLTARPDRLPAFVVRLGPDVVRRELAKLGVISTLQRELGVGDGWRADEGVPTAEIIESQLKALAGRVRSWAEERREIERDESTSLKDAKAIASLLDKVGHG